MKYEEYIWFRKFNTAGWEHLICVECTNNYQTISHVFNAKQLSSKKPTTCKITKGGNVQNLLDPQTFIDYNSVDE